MSMGSSKTQQLNLRLAIALLCAGTVAMSASSARADTATADTPADTGSLDEVIVTGTRQSGTKAADSAAPIQIISTDALRAASGNPDLMSTLSQLVPSLTMQAFGFDMGGQTLQAKLRGLSPNHVLVLVNGKRRHTTANLAVDPSPYEGGAGVDLNLIPVDAIDHIEVLTDGAAAQYGTDAIAGVINIILKKKASGGSLTGTYGNYENGGGNTSDVSGNVGLEPTDGGYFNLTGQVHNHGHSNQGGVDPRVVSPKNLGTYPDVNMASINGYPYLNQIDGDGEQHLKLAAVNTGFIIEGGPEIYAFGTYGDKKSASFENYRLPDKAQFTDPLTKVTTYPLPFGFNPEEMSAEKDYSLTGGVKGTVVGWNWDLSTTYGGDKADVYTINSYNTNTYNVNGFVTPTNFYDGYLKTTQWTTQGDFDRDFDVGLAGPLNVAFGAEYRRETYTIGAGIPASYLGGGASSYPGFTPTDAAVNSRKNYSGYVDLAAKPIDGLKIDAAGRYEHYSDFGSAEVGKLSARFDFTPQIAIRGTVSNGFRAPTLAEEFYSSTNVGPTTAFVQLPPNSAGGKVLGLGNGLQPEHSMNFSAGLVWRPLAGMTATLDVYQITVTNRIVNTGNVYGTVLGTPTAAAPAVNAAIAANGNVLDPSVVATGSTGINIFANGNDTRTRGSDLVFDFPVDYSFAKIDWSIGATYNETSITKVASAPASLGGVPFYDATALSDLTTASPRLVANFGALVTAGKVTVNVVEKVYGKSADYENDDGDGPTGNPVYYKSTIGVSLITNLDVAYQFTDHLRFNLGAINLFDRFPNKLNGTLRTTEYNAGDNAAVQQYPTFSPYGINGGFWYVKAAYTF